MESASHEQTTQQRANETICAAYSLGDAPSKYPAELLLASSSITKRRSGGRYLLVIMRAGGIGVGKVDLCGACDQEQTKVRNLPFGRFRGPLCPVAIGVPHFPHCTIWQPRFAVPAQCCSSDRFDVFLTRSFVWASFFSSRDIGQVHFSNMK